MKNQSRYINVDALAEIMNLRPGTIYHRRLKNPSSLPPTTKIPGSCKVLWKRDIVEKWLSQFDPDPAQIKLPKRRGRPRKVEAATAAQGVRS